MKSDRDMPIVDDDALSQVLRDPVAAPDQKRAIMGRLGYMRVDPEIARRRRLWFNLGRLGCMALIITAGMIGFGWYSAAGDFRAPAEVTLPSAIAGQVQRQQSTLNGLFESMRRPQVNFASHEESTEVSTKVQPIPDEPVERFEESDLLPSVADDPAELAIGPYRWT